MRWYCCVILATMILFSACGVEIEKQRLEKEHLALMKSRMELEKEFEKLQQEKDKLFHSSAKERFAFLYAFQEEKPVDLKNHSENFVSIEWHKKGDKYAADLKIQPKKTPFLPRFVVFLYDKKGLILGYHYEKPGVFKSKIPVGKLVEKKMDFKLVEKSTPEYFGITYHNPVE
ncbi:MAG: hypothetical protein HUU50_03885 [Candidatus Brocadiae bacterium]|nr:hypothetical protein [Candidatus Brocadiia bacterium]